MFELYIGHIFIERVIEGSPYLLLADRTSRRDIPCGLLSIRRSSLGGLTSAWFLLIGPGEAPLI